MANNQDFDINIRVNADTTQVEAIRQSFEKLGAQVEVTNRQAAATSGSGAGGALGSQLGGVFGLSEVAVGLALNRAIKAYGDEQIRIAEEAGKHLNILIQSAKTWDDIARAATSTEDVLKLAETATKTVNDAQQEFLTFQNKGLAGWKEWIDALTTIPGITSGVFDKLFTDEASRLADAAQKARDVRRHAVEDAKTTTDAFDEEKLKPFDEAFKDINDKLQEQTRLQQQVGTSNIDSYIAIGKQIENYKAQLKELITLENQRKREAQQTADEREKDVDFVQEQVRRASPTARAILMNEQAAQLARDQGRERDADMFGRTVQQLKGSATPGQQSETAVLEKLIEQNGILREIRDTWR